MYKYKNYLLIMSIISVIFIISGCWSYNPLRDRSIVVAMGLDKGLDDKFELTLQIANPALIKPDQIIQENAVTLVSDSGDTVFEAVRKILEQVNRKPYYGHLQLIVIGENLAKDGIEEILDVFERDYEPRLTPYVIVVKGLTAKEVLEAKSTFEYIPAMHIKGTIDNTKSSGEIIRTKLIDIIKQVNYPEYNPVTGVIEKGDALKVNRVSDMKIEGAALFKHTKLIGYLDGIETRSLSFVKDDMKGGLMKVKNPLDEDKLVSIEILDSNSETTVNLEGNKPIFTVSIKVESSIGGQQGRGDLTTKEMIINLEEEVKSTINKEINEMLKKVQKEYKTDVLGFAEIVSKYHPVYWSANKNDWQNIFEDVSVILDTEVDIVRIGLINKTTESQ